MSKKIILASFPHRDKSNAPHQYNDGLNTNQRLRVSALKASNHGECWWIYRFIMFNPMLQARRD